MVALIIHRYDSSITGGAESYAREITKILKDDVEVLTTTAIDHTTWDNHYEEGVYEEDGIKIRRFNVDIKRSSYWVELHNILLKKEPSKLSIPFCEEWIKQQGPYSNSLLEYIKNSNYDKYIFITYLYPTTYFGIDLVENSIILSTYHNEPPFFMPIFKKYSNYHHIFLTKEEEELANKYIEPKSSSILGFGIKKYNVKRKLEEKFFLYAGRIEESKGVKELIELHSKFYEKYKIPLYIIGKGDLELLEGKEGVIYKGFVSEEDKYTYMKSAIAFIHPSAYESLGIVLLESFSQATPAVVTQKSSVLSQHIDESKGGEIYRDYDSFEKSLLKILESRREYSLNSYCYYKKYYSYSKFKERVLELKNK